MMHQAGLPLFARTDVSDQVPGYSLPFGISLHDELVSLVEEGFTPAEGLREATALPERLLDCEIGV
ncbi:hypothetical protein K432DRAFT_116681 [Lepidopterella palustris CBS 459.81]|uniref:Uncharacterized protein n=1 Tax=Lepidopterella palustris CBS 459.81 TaxID=1314670 RepID=A0A8E2E557_9PEZI|nr:hypothetical protein K432DRAFT_116681 [Lepidopterella palustris CBS 459.81]